MSVNESFKDGQKIEQLWYTWSDVGLGGGRPGYRIRAASEGLHDMYNEHVKSLDRYQRYSLPLEADLDIPLELAPVCLSCIIREEDRILVHKEYTGKDAFGRSGVFFIHLLDNLPPDFSAADAISLWKSSFWQNSDVSLKKKDPYGTRLDSIPYEGWKRAIKDLRKRQDARKLVSSELDAEHAHRFEEDLSYLIRIYLIKKSLFDSPRREPEKIYIAAPDRYIALLISGLTHCLPEPLVKDLTFSTYESDVRAAPTEIIGTCWLSVPGAEHAPQVRGLLPSSYYSERLALNCYTRQRTPLENFPLAERSSLVMEYARQATAYFLSGNSEFQEFLDGTEDASRGTVEDFLIRYKTEVLSAQGSSEEDIEFALANSDLQYAARMLSKKGYQQKCIKLVLNKSGWWDKFARQHIIRLREHSAELPRLAHELAQLASDAIPYATDIVKEAIAGPYISQSIAANDRERFRIIKEVMQCAAPPAEEPGVWIDLLKDLWSIPDVFVFFNSDWQCYAELMNIWATLLPHPLSKEDYRLVDPLLSSLSWARFGDFLALDLPLDWCERATALLISKTTSLLDREIVSSLEQQHHSRIAILVRQLSRERASFTQAGSERPLSPDARPWHTVGKLFAILAANHYGRKAELLSLLLDSPMGRKPENAENLLTVAHLITMQEIIAFLKANGPRSLSLYEKMSTTILNMFGDLAKRDDAEARAGKMDVLGCWLEAPQLRDWLIQPPDGEKHLAQILKAARLNTEEDEAFFRYYGKRYIALYPGSPTLLDLFDHYSRTAGERRREFFFYWLDLPELPLVIFNRALQAVHFNDQERIQFIERYGELFLLRYPQSQELLRYVLEYLAYIQVADLNIFLKTFPSPDIPTGAENFLGFLLNWPQLDPGPKPMINEYYLVAQLMRKPALLNPASVVAAGQLLAKRDLADNNRDKLMKKLAMACLEHEMMPLVPTITTLSKMLPPKEVQALLEDIAVTARNGLREQRYPLTLFVPVIRFALTFFQPFLPEIAPENVTLRFLRTLLTGIDEKRLKWLDREAKKWPEQEAAEWRRYRRLLSPSDGAKRRWWEKKIE